MTIGFGLDDDVEMRKSRFQSRSPGSHISSEPHVARHAIDYRVGGPAHGVARRRNIACAQAFFCYEGGNEHF